MAKTSIKTQKPTLLRNIFYTGTETHLKAGWRLAIHTLLILLLSIPVGIILFIPVGVLKIDFASPLALLADEATLLISITTATFLAAHFLDKRPIISLGLNPGSQAFADLAIGILISFFQMALVFGLEMLLGWARFENFAWTAQSTQAILKGVGIWLLLFLVVGWQEELLFRGYHLQTIAGGLSLPWGVVISTLLFSLAHLFNQGATILSVLGIFAIGLFLSLPYIVTKQLWLSIGLHIGWNFFEGVVFGFPVSGLATFRLINHTVSGPEIWTGGVFGPEAGLVIIPALLLGTFLVLAYTNQRVRKPQLD